MSDNSEDLIPIKWTKSETSGSLVFVYPSELSQVYYEETGVELDPEDVRYFLEMQNDYYEGKIQLQQNQSFLFELNAFVQGLVIAGFEPEELPHLLELSFLL